MRNYLKHIDDFFREKLGRYAETPPADVWDSLEGRLDTLVPGAPAPKPGVFRWLKHLGMLSIIAVLTLPLLKKINGSQATDATNTTTQFVASSNAGVPSAPAKLQPGTQNSNDQVEATNSVNTTSTPSENRSAGETPAVPQPSTAVIVSSGNKGNKKVAANAYVAKSKNKNLKKPAKTTAKAKYAMNVAATNSYAVNNADENEELPGSRTSNIHGPNMPSDEQVKKSIVEQKKETSKAITKANKEEQAKSSKTNGKFEAGVKLGFERGRNDLVANKYTISPYLQYNIGGRFSLMTQPALKYASQSTHQVGSAQSYNKMNDDGTATQNGATQKGYVVEGGSITDSLFTTNYTYKQSHDSIVKTYTHGGNYLEIELPILLKYAITKQLSVYGGVNISYSTQNAIVEHTYVKQGIMQSMDSINTSAGSQSHLAISDVIKTPGTPYSDYTKPVYSAQQSNPLRIGYMAGFSYEYSNRWLVDVLMQQTPVKPYLQGGYNTNAALSAPYFRLSVGYKFLK